MIEYLFPIQLHNANNLIVYDRHSLTMCLQGLLGPKKELWDLLQKVEKKDSEAADITASVRDLPTVKTAVGRARVWLREGSI